jgi:hypothetical protein
LHNGQWKSVWWKRWTINDAHWAAWPRITCVVIW